MRLTEVTMRAVVLTLQLDRWYWAATGCEWDSTLLSIQTLKRQLYTARNHHVPVQVERERVRAAQTPRTFRTSHLMVEPLDAEGGRGSREEAQQVVWPDALDVGRLEWDTDDGLACCFCGSLLLPSEAGRMVGARDCWRGMHCCKEG